MLFDKLTESVTYNAIAKECDTSITTVLRYYSMITIPKPRTLPTVIGIDEFKRIAAHLTHWLKLVKASGLNEFNNFFTSFPAWMTQLTNAVLLPYSNGYTEGTNNKIKVLKRISYGLRHFGRFRVRILLLSKKNGTNHTYDWCQRRLVG